MSYEFIVSPLIVDTALKVVNGQTFKIQKKNAKVYEIFSKDTLLTEAFSFQDALNQCDSLGIISNKK